MKEKIGATFLISGVVLLLLVVGSVIGPIAWEWFLKEPVTYRLAYISVVLICVGIIIILSSDKLRDMTID